MPELYARIKLLFRGSKAFRAFSATEVMMRANFVFSLAAAMAFGAPVFAFAQATPPLPTAPVIQQGGGIAGTGLGRGAGAGGVQTTTAPLVNRARSPLVISGTGHIGAGTGGLGLGLGNAVGGIKDTAIGSGSGGLSDGYSWGTHTGGILGSGRGLGAGSGGLKDTAAAGIGIDTGGIHGSAIGAGVGGLRDLNSLGAGTGGTSEGLNSPRFRRIQ
jgi:hypothetical protein